MESRGGASTPAHPIKLPDETWKTYKGGLDSVKHVKHDLVVRVVETTSGTSGGEGKMNAGL